MCSPRNVVRDRDRFIREVERFEPVVKKRLNDIEYCFREQETIVAFVFFIATLFRTLYKQGTFEGNK